MYENEMRRGRERGETERERKGEIERVR